MLRATFSLGFLPALANAVVTACIGYFTVQYKSSTVFYELLLCINLTAAFVTVVMTRYDKAFDKLANPHIVYGVRIFLPLMLLVAGFFLTSIAMDMYQMLLGVAVLGMSAGLLTTVGSLLIAQTSRQHLSVWWFSNASASLLAWALCYLLAFKPSSSPAEFQKFFVLAGGAAALFSIPLAVMHNAGELDEAYKASGSGQSINDGESPEQLPPETATIADAQPIEEKPVYAEYVAFANVLLTSLPIPLLPLVFMPATAQALISWKYCTEFFGALCLGMLPEDASLPCRVVVLLGRALILLVLCLWFLLSRSGEPPAYALVLWCLYMGVGFALSGVNDTSGPDAGFQQRIGRNRAGSFLGLATALAINGLLLYVILPAGGMDVNLDHGMGLVQGEGLRAYRRQGCPSCVALEPHTAAISCEPEAKAPASRMQSGNVTQVFAYGANVDCKKHRDLGITPQASFAATIHDYCLAFGAGPRVPTSQSEPAFGTLIPCGGGCVHGVVQTWFPDDLAVLSRSEPGYVLTPFKAVTPSKEEREVLTYIMDGPLKMHAPSPRYLGKVYCSRRHLGEKVGDQLECEATALGMDMPNCSQSFRTIIPGQTQLKLRHSLG